MSNDPLSDVLKLTEAQSVISGGFAAGGTWALRFPAPQQIVFSAIAKGTCFLRLEGQKTALRLDEGDVGLLPGKRGFILGSSATARPTDVVLTNDNWETESINGGSDCVVLAGRVSLHPSNAAFLVDALPSRVHIRASSPRAASLRWLLEAILEERTSTVPGARIASAQLAQLLFTQILRAHVASAGPLPTGWLRAVGDERLLRALRRMHDDPRHPWRLGELAKAAGMSRTRFAVHFSAVAGVAPLTYLAEWRMRLAQRTLREEDTSVLELATSMGYASESAFSHAFKRITGMSPRHYRDAVRRGPAGAEERTASAPT